MSDEKFLKLRNGVWEHFSPDNLPPTEFLVYLRLLSLADMRTGQVRTTVSHIAVELNGSYRPNTVKQALLFLERKGYIGRKMENTRTGLTLITINKYEITAGSKTGKRIELPPAIEGEGVPVVTPSVPVVTPKPSWPLHTEHPNTVGCSRGNTETEYASFSFNEINELRPLRIRKEGEEDLEEARPASFSANTETERPPVEETERGAGAEPRIETANGKGTEQPVHPKGKAVGTISVQFGPGGKKSVNRATASIPSVPAAPFSALDGKPIPSWMPLSHPLQNTDANFDALDWAFSLTEPVNGMEPAEIRRAVYWHWNHDAKKFWRDQDIPTIARFTAALPKMLSQVPKKFRRIVTGGKIPYVNPGCEICQGTGVAEIIPNPAYPEDSQFTAAIGCSCKTLHPYPWRIERKEIQ